MNSSSQLQIWDLWYSKAGATGIPFARLDKTSVLPVHAPPPLLSVEVRSESGQRLADAQDPEQTVDRPMARFSVQGQQATRQDLGPTLENIGRAILLPGGEVGKLVSFWNAEDGSEWRWKAEFYNHR